MLKIIKGPAGSGKSEYIFEQMRQLAEQGRRSMLIVPESVSHLTERRLIETCGNAGTAYASVTTFSRLTEELLSTCGARFMDEGGRTLAMYRALQQVRGELRHYRQRTFYADFIRGLTDTAAELKACLVTPERLMRAAEDGDMTDKLRDIALIYSAYCAECERGELDPGDRLDKACEYIASSGIFADAEVFIDDFTGLTAQKYKALELILQSCAGMTAALMMTDDRQLFAEQHQTLQRLSRMAEHCGVQLCSETLTRTDERPAELVELGERFFDFSCGAYDGDCGAIKIYAAADLDAECELAAATVRRLAAEEGVRLRETAVLCPDIREYAGRLENQFERYEIPLYIGEKADIAAKPAVRAATGALEALCDGLSEGSVFDYLKSGLFPMDGAVRDRLENYVYLWGISGGRWHSPFTRPTTGYDASAEGEEERLEEINSAREQISGELTALAELMAGSRTGGERARALAEHLRRTDYEGRLGAAVQRLRAEGRAREAGEYAQLFNIVIGAIEQFEGVMGDVTMDMREFLDLFMLMLSRYDVSTIPMSLDSVTATGFESFAPRGIRHLIVIGAREGLFPGTPAGAGLLSESERIALETEGIELTQTAEQRAWQRFSYIYRALSSPAERLYFIYPSRLPSGEEGRCSYFVRRVPEIFPGVRIESGDALLRRLRLSARKPAFESACVYVGGGDGSVAAMRYFCEKQGMEGYFRSLREYAAAPRGPIRDSELVRRLYGNELRMTASRLEKVNSCRFSYFMQYGLKAAARRRGDFGPPQIGSFIHYVVEKAVEDVFRKGAEPEAAARKHVREYVEQTFPQRELSERFKANLRALGENAVFVVQNACDEINAGDFRPVYFEMNFGAGGDVPPLRIRHGEVTLSVSGKIDRVDGYLHDGRLYLKVADYKTGSKVFHLSDVLYGLNLQMFLYLMLLQRGAGEQLAAQTGAESVPCAALYIPAVNPFVDAPPGTPPEKVRAEIDKSLRRMGLLPAERSLLDAMEHPGEKGYRFLPVGIKRDGDFTAASAVARAEQFGRIIKKTEGILRGIAERLAAGDIEANPYSTGRDFTVCRWCDYRAACHFDESMEKDNTRYLPSLSSAEVHRLLEEEEKND